MSCGTRKYSCIDVPAPKMYSNAIIWLKDRCAEGKKCKSCGCFNFTTLCVTFEVLWKLNNYLRNFSQRVLFSVKIRNLHIFIHLMNFFKETTLSLMFKKGMNLFKWVLSSRLWISWRWCIYLNWSFSSVLIFFQDDEL